MGKTYAYARVSAKDQNLQRQLSAFNAFGVDPRRIFCDKKSGKDCLQPEVTRQPFPLRHGVNTPLPAHR